ncbi:MAG: hypothetical protein AAFY39_10350 [Pseudomonadota bacterium]
MTRTAILFAALFGSTSALADEAADKAQSCQYQADVVAAVQQARLDRVKEREVQAHILAQDPAWPEKFNNTIPLIAPWVYEQKRRIIRTEDLSAVWTELCLQLPADAAAGQ